MISFRRFSFLILLGLLFGDSPWIKADDARRPPVKPPMPAARESHCADLTGALDGGAAPRSSLTENSFRRVWGNLELRRAAKRFLLYGMFKDDAGLANQMVRRIGELLALEPPLKDEAIYGELRKTLLERRSAFEAAMKRNDEERIQHRIWQIQSMLGHRPRSIIDIGAGEGHIVKGLAMDYEIPRDDAHAVEVATYPGNDRVNWLGYRDGKIPLADGKMDLATVLMVLHHTEDPQATLKEAYRLLAEGGMLIVRETDAPSHEAKLFNQVMDSLYYKVFAEDWGVPLPNRYLGKEEWKREFENAGFEVVSLSETDRQNPFTPFFAVLRKPARH